MFEDLFQIITAYETGLEDGFFDGDRSRYENLNEDQKYAYNRGYDKGVLMFCQSNGEQSESDYYAELNRGYAKDRI